MKITRCKYGHYYDKEYFHQCPHCHKEEKEKAEKRREKQEESVVQNKKRIIDKQSAAQNEKKISGDQSAAHKKNYEITMRADASRFVIMAAIPPNVKKNQEFCVDFCILLEDRWKNGADMLVFKNKEGIRDIKIVPLELPARGQVQILYKEEILFESEPLPVQEEEIGLYTFPVCVTDNRDRRFHMIKMQFEVKEQKILVPLYLQPDF